ncbi:thioredoxin-like protein [Coprinopsis sp. MPI-PUGE-AT-0042]|nr:thioredoxin-like protein [Coprinopsis sp. MPI-PUGE-AT-0042]
MPPRAKSTEGSAEPPRRSTRIASQPQTPAEVAPKPARKASSSKKRVAEEPAEDKEAEASKKSTEPTANAEESAEPTVAAALGPIDIGDSLPFLVLKNEKGEDVQIADLAKDKGVVLFLVPKADTAGCTTQACAFRDSYPDFTSRPVKWQTKKELPYPLISDPKRILIAALGASKGGKTNRSHFIFEKGGKLLDKKNPVKPAESPQLALEFIKSLQPAEGQS